MEKTISDLGRSSLGVQVELLQASSFVGNYSYSLGASGFVPAFSRGWTSSSFRGNALQNISTVWKGLFLWQVNLGATPQPQKSFTNRLMCVTQRFALGGLGICPELLILVNMFVDAVKTVVSHGSLCVCLHNLHLHGAISGHFASPPQWVNGCALRRCRTQF